MTIGSGGRAGTIDPVPVMDTPFVDSLIAQARMSFYPAQAGKSVTIDLSFTTRVILKADDNLTLYLPNFGDMASSGQLLVSTRPLGMLQQNGYWEA